MDGWMDGWMDGCTDGRMDGRIDGLMGDECMRGRTYAVVLRCKIGEGIPEAPHPKPYLNPKHPFLHGLVKARLVLRAAALAAETLSI